MFKVLNVDKVFLIAAFIVSKKIIQQHWLKMMVLQYITVWLF